MSHYEDSVRIENDLVAKILGGINVFITGSAGTGKTALLKRIITRLLNSDIRSDAIVFATLTGLASRIASTDEIRARTIGSIFGGVNEHDIITPDMSKEAQERIVRYSMPVQASEMSLKVEVILRGCRYLIIDEVSLINKKHLAVLDIKLRIATGRDAHMGGAVLIFTGDFLQAPPQYDIDRLSKDREYPNQHLDDFIQSIYAFNAKEWVRSAFYVQMLTFNWRQLAAEISPDAKHATFGTLKLHVGSKVIARRDISVAPFGTTGFVSGITDEGVYITFEGLIPSLIREPEAVLREIPAYDATYAALLDRMRLNKMTIEDMQALEKRVFPEGRIPDSAIRLFENAKPTEDYNAERQRSLNGLSYTYKKVVYTRLSAHIDERELESDIKKGAIDSITLSVGSKVILKVNIDISRGLVNGCIGVVVRFQKPTIMFENFVCNMVPVVDFGTTGIHAIEPYKYTTITLGEFVQLPLLHAWALTITSAQGMTMSAIVMSIPQSMRVGNAYVGISRVTSMEGIYFLKSPAYIACAAYPAALMYYLELENRTPAQIRLLEAQQKFLIDERKNVVQVAPTAHIQEGYSSAVRRNIMTYSREPIIHSRRHLPSELTDPEKSRDVRYMASVLLGGFLEMRISDKLVQRADGLREYKSHTKKIYAVSMLGSPADIRVVLQDVSMTGVLVVADSRTPHERQFKQLLTLYKEPNPQARGKVWGSRFSIPTSIRINSQYFAEIGYYEFRNLLGSEGVYSEDLANALGVGELSLMEELHRELVIVASRKVPNYDMFRKAMTNASRLQPGEHYSKSDGDKKKNLFGEISQFAKAVYNVELSISNEATENGAIRYIYMLLMTSQFYELYLKNPYHPAFMKVADKFSNPLCEVLSMFRRYASMFDHKTRLDVFGAIPYDISFDQAGHKTSKALYQYMMKVQLWNLAFRLSEIKHGALRESTGGLRYTSIASELVLTAKRDLVRDNTIEDFEEAVVGELFTNGLAEYEFCWPDGDYKNVAKHEQNAAKSWCQYRKEAEQQEGGSRSERLTASRSLWYATKPSDLVMQTLRNLVSCDTKVFAAKYEFKNAVKIVFDEDGYSYHFCDIDPEIKALELEAFDEWCVAQDNANLFRSNDVEVQFRSDESALVSRTREQLRRQKERRDTMKKHFIASVRSELSKSGLAYEFLPLTPERYQLKYFTRTPQHVLSAMKYLEEYPDDRSAILGDYTEMVKSSLEDAGTDYKFCHLNSKHDALARCERQALDDFLREKLNMTMKELEAKHYDFKPSVDMVEALGLSERPSELTIETYTKLRTKPPTTTMDEFKERLRAEFDRVGFGYTFSQLGVSKYAELAACEREVFGQWLDNKFAILQSYEREALDSIDQGLRTYEEIKEGGIRYFVEPPARIEETISRIAVAETSDKREEVVASYKARIRSELERLGFDHRFSVPDGALAKYEREVLSEWLKESQIPRTIGDIAVKWMTEDDSVGEYVLSEEQAQETIYEYICRSLSRIYGVPYDWSYESPDIKSKVVPICTIESTANNIGEIERTIARFTRMRYDESTRKSIESYGSMINHISERREILDCFYVMKQTFTQDKPIMASVYELVGLMPAVA